MRMCRAGDIQGRNLEGLFGTVAGDCVAGTNRLGRQITVVWIEQHDLRAAVELAIGHQLIHIGLADTLLRVVDARRHPFPFRVDDEDGSIPLPDDEVRLGPKPPRTRFEKAVTVPALRCDTVSASGQSTGDQSGNVLLEQGIHLEQESMTICSPGTGLLMSIPKQEPREGKKLAPPLIGPIQYDLVPSQR